MATFVPPKRGVALTFYVGLVARATRPQLQAAPTLAAGDVQVSKDGGAFANLTTLPVVTPAGGRAVKVDLSATEMTADQVVVQFVDAAGAEWDDLFINIQTAARQIDDLAFPATSGRSMVVDAAGLVDANAVKVGPTGTGTAQTAGDIMADTNDIQARLPAVLVGGRIDASVGAMAANVLTAAAINAAALNGKGDWNTGKTGYALAAAEYTALVNLIWDELTAEARTAGSYGQLSKDNLNATVSSRAIPGDLMGLVASAITSAKFAAGAIDAAAIATDAIGSAEFAQAAADKIWASVTRSLTDKAGFALAAAEYTALVNLIYDGLTTEARTAASYGQLLKDNLNATVGSRASQASLDAVQADTDNIQTRLPAALDTGRIVAKAEVVSDKTGYDLSAAGVDAILDDVVEGTLTLRQLVRIVLAAVGGKSSGFPAGPAIYRDNADTKARITATVDADGNRSAVTLDGA